MNFNVSAVFLIFLGLFTIGSGTKCYFCSSLISKGCAHGVHYVDNLFFSITECHGKCAKLVVPISMIEDKVSTAKMCVPFITETGYQEDTVEEVQNMMSVDECLENEYCYICDGDLCNAAEKNTGVAFSIALTLSMLTFLMF